MSVYTGKLSAYLLRLDEKHSSPHRFALIGILLLGLCLRFYTLYVGQAYIYFAINDEVTSLQYALGLLAGDPHMFYLGSPVLNQGHVPGPLWTLLIAGLYKLGGNSAEGAIAGMIILNTVAIYLVYRFALAFLPARYALLSSLLFATSPWVIYYAANLYNPVTLALLGVLLFHSLWQTVQNDQSRMIFWVCLVAAAVPQFHMIGIFYLPVVLLLLYLSPQAINIRWLVTGGVAGVCLYIPYLIGDYLHHWQNTRGILIGEKGFSAGILKIITIPITMLANHPGQWAGPAFASFKSFGNQYFGSYIVLIVLNLVSLALAILFCASFLRKTFRYLREKSFRLKACFIQHPQHMYIAVLLILPLLLYSLTGRHYTTRYSILIFPLLYLLPSLFLLNLPAGRLKQVTLYSLFLLLFVNIYLVLGFYTDQARRLKHDAAFMPSFARLAVIKQHLDTVVQAGEQVEFTYAESIKHLPEGQRKLYQTIVDYMHAHAEATQRNNSDKPKRLHIMPTSEIKETSPLTRVIYSSPALTILELTPASP